MSRADGTGRLVVRLVSRPVRDSTRWITYVSNEAQPQVVCNVTLDAEFHSGSL